LSRWQRAGSSGISRSQKQGWDKRAKGACFRKRLFVDLFEVPMDQILVPVKAKLHIVGEQQAEPCCSNHFIQVGCFGYGRGSMQLQPVSPLANAAA
jgi:hypothetical protein